MLMVKGVGTMSMCTLYIHGLSLIFEDLFFLADGIRGCIPQVIAAGKPTEMRKGMILTMLRI